MPTRTEPELIALACTGDHQAFKSLVETYERFVFSIALRFTRDEAEAEDLTQECFIRFWRNLNRYNAEFKLKTWLGKMITNLCLDYLKSARKRFETQSTHMAVDFEKPDPSQPEKELQASELHVIILRFAEFLTPKQKAAFILRDLEMLEVSEVCDMLNETAENLKSNLYHARKHIRENLLKHYKTNFI